MYYYTSDFLPHRVYVIGSMIEGSELLRSEFKKSWEISTKLGSYVSFYDWHKKYSYKFK